MRVSAGIHHVVARAVADSSGGSSDLSSKIGEHKFWCLGGGNCTPTNGAFGGPQFNVDTILMTLIVMGLIIVLALIARSRLTSEAPRGIQNVLEFAVDFVNGFVKDSLGAERLASIGPLAVALFLFILLSNYIGLIPIPLNVGGVNLWHSPTSDLNTTLALTLVVLFTIHGLSVRARGGGGYIAHYFQPYWWLFPINLIEEIAKPVTLMMRLFGNIFAGEVLVLVFATLLSGPAVFALPLPHAFALGLGLFVGAIQAFVFTLLTVAYIGIATATEGH